MYGYTDNLAPVPPSQRAAIALGGDVLRQLLARTRSADAIKHPEKREHLLGLTEAPAVIDERVDRIQLERDARRLGEEEARAGRPYATRYGQEHLQMAYADGYGDGIDV